MLLALGAPASAAAAGGVSAFYYPWYGTPELDGSYLHWQHEGHFPPTDIAAGYYPARGLYSSADPALLAAHMREMASIGIDEVVSSWWGWGSPEDLRLPAVIAAARARGLEVAVQIEPYEKWLRSLDVLEADLGHLRQLGITRAYVFKPFDGVYTYDIVHHTPTTFRRLCAKARALRLVCAPSVGPGYDARRVTGDPRVLGRRGGTTYDAMWAAALEAGADRVTITSYNEWHEGTQIEAATAVAAERSGSRGPASSPVEGRYASYDGAWGLTGTKAGRAYLVRTAVWTRLFHAMRSTLATAQAAAGTR